jgi:hypothetical protein
MFLRLAATPRVVSSEIDGLHHRQASRNLFDSCDASVTLAAMSANSAQITSINHRSQEAPTEVNRLMVDFLRSVDGKSAAK